MAALSVVLDTNVLVSGLAFPVSVPGRIVAAWRQGGLDAVLSRYIIDELSRVLPRLNHRLKWRESDFLDLFDILAVTIELVDPSPVADERLRDLTDRPVLGTLIAARADYLVTGDKNLLALADHYPIVSPAAFWDRHGG